MLAHGRDWGLAAALLRSYHLELVPVSVADAEGAAMQWRPGDGLSLGDRLCLALAERLDQPALTADRSWGRSARIQQIR